MQTQTHGIDEYKAMIAMEKKANSELLFDEFIASLPVVDLTKPYNELTSYEKAVVDDWEWDDEL